MKLLFVDTETGGPNPDSDCILSIAALILEDGRVLDGYYYTLINEGEHVATSMCHVNGLTIEKVQSEGVSPLEVVTSIEAMLDRHDMRQDVIVAAHSAPFDVGFMRRLWRLVGHDFNSRFSYRMLCTHSVALFLQYADLIPQGKASLDALAALLGVELNREAGHNALNDARAGAAILQKLTEVARDGYDFFMYHIDTVPKPGV